MSAESKARVDAKVSELRITALEAELTAAREEIAALKEDRKNAAREYLHCDSARIELIQERDELKADKERLEFLISTLNVWREYATWVFDWHPTLQTSRETASDEEWRQSIDAARKAEGK